MKQYYLKIISKNEKSLKNFLSFFFKHLKTKYNIIQKSVIGHNHTKIITLLKSPHVNKTAQEHFELRMFSKQMLIKSSYTNRNIIFLKKILTKLFHDISINIEFVANFNIINKNRLLVFYPDNFKLFRNKPLKTNSRRLKQKFISTKYHLKKDSLFELNMLLNTISVFGEITVVCSSK